MGSDDIIQFQSEEDGCVYFYDEKREIWKKISDVKSPSDLPLSIKRQVREAQNMADLVLSVPL